MRPKVDKDLLPMKAHYFLFNAGTAPVVPFMPTLAKQLGYSSVVVGTMYTILPIIGMLAKPVLGFIADRYQRHRMLFIISEILTAIAFFLIMFTPAIDKAPPIVEFHCHSGETYLRYDHTHADQCFSNSLQNHYANATSDLGCKLKCPAEPYMWNIICDHWLNSIDCKPNSTDTLELNANLDMSDIMVEQKYMYFKIPHTKGQLDGKDVIMYCPKDDQHYFNATCTLDCNDDYLNHQLAVSPVIDNHEAMSLGSFWWFFSMLILSWIGMAAVVSIGDAICFGILGERAHLYGKQRLYGSIGWGLFSIIAGVLVDKMSSGVDKDYTIVFCMTAVIIALDVIASIKLKHTQTHLSPNILKDVGQMFLSVRCVVFFIWCVFIGLGTALIWNFLFWHLEDLAGCEDTSMKTLQGLVMAIQCFCGELPFFFFSGWILKKIGHVNTMSLVLFGFGVRFILYSMLQDPWYVLPIELLNGVTFGLFYATMASYASIVAPPGTETTMQGLVGAIFEGVGVSTGSFVGGLLFSSVGPGHTFEIFGVAAFVAFIVHVCLQMYLQRHHSALDSDNNGKQQQQIPINLSSSSSVDTTPTTCHASTGNITANDSTKLTKNFDDKSNFTNVDLNDDSV